MQAGRGKTAPRFKEADLWPICVENKFHPSDPSFTAKINAFAKEKGGAEMLQFCIHNQDSLLSIGEKIWAVEDAEKIIRENAKTRLQIVQETAQQPCVCVTAGKWKGCARHLLQSNQISEMELTAAIHESLDRGRVKGGCVTLCGQQGNEGKSFILRPLLQVFGEKKVFQTPSASSFPLLGIEDSRIIFWDDYRFSTQVLSISQQLLLLEGGSRRRDSGQMGELPRDAILLVDANYWQQYNKGSRPHWPNRQRAQGLWSSLQTFTPALVPKVQELVHRFQADLESLTKEMFRLMEASLEEAEVAEVCDNLISTQVLGISPDGQLCQYVLWNASFHSLEVGHQWGMVPIRNLSKSKLKPRAAPGGSIQRP